MLITKYFAFNRKGELTIFALKISHANLMLIIKECVKHARSKKSRKPCKFRLLEIPILTDAV
jgi:hypothetical protein